MEIKKYKIEYYYEGEVWLMVIMSIVCLVITVLLFVSCSHFPDGVGDFSPVAQEIHPICK